MLAAKNEENPVVYTESFQTERRELLLLIYSLFFFHHFIHPGGELPLVSSWKMRFCAWAIEDGPKSPFPMPEKLSFGYAFVIVSFVQKTSVQGVRFELTIMSYCKYIMALVKRLVCFRKK
jgi:hypothetical protein